MIKERSRCQKFQAFFQALLQQFSAGAGVFDVWQIKYHGYFFVAAVTEAFEKPTQKHRLQRLRLIDVQLVAGLQVTVVCGGFSGIVPFAW